VTSSSIVTSTGHASTPYKYDEYIGVSVPQIGGKG